MGQIDHNVVVPNYVVYGRRIIDVGFSDIDVQFSEARCGSHISEHGSDAGLVNCGQLLDKSGADESGCPGYKDSPPLQCACVYESNASSGNGCNWHGSLLV